MELLRIISMFLVLIVHASFQSIGAPTQEEIVANPLSSLCRFTSQSFSDVCVNVFIFISGWYGIRPKKKRLCEFLFQIYFMMVALYVIFLLMGRVSLWKFTEWYEAITFFKGNWFILSYIVMYSFSPVLNSFVEKVQHKQFKYFLLAFFIIQTFFGFIHNTSFFQYGYSPLSFFTLYLLARYIRLYPNKWTMRSKWFDMCMYVCMSSITNLCAISYTYITGNTDRFFYAYTSPLIIIASLYFLLFFTKISIKNHHINWVASSSFAVFLLHTDPIFFMPYYLGPIKRWFLSETLSVFLFNTTSRILCVFVIAIIIDKIRIFVWNMMFRCYRKSISK